MKVFRGDAIAVDNLEAVILEEIIHVVEVAVTTVEKFGAVTLFVEDLAQREQIFVVWTFYQGTSSRRRH